MMPITKKQFIRDTARAVDAKINDLRKYCASTLVEALEAYLASIGGKTKVVSLEEMPEAEALARTEEQLLQIRSDVYESFKRSEPRAVFTFIHEIGHFILGHKGIAARSQNRREMYWNSATNEQESEANLFAAEFLMPVEVVNGMSAEDIIKTCGVSRSAAERRVDEIAREMRRENGEVRHFTSSIIIDFFKERAKRGEKLKTKLPPD
jgi:Zn-dependent peptidase ImmA (M78 family)